MFQETSHDKSPSKYESIGCVRGFEDDHHFASTIRIPLQQESLLLIGIDGRL